MAHVAGSSALADTGCIIPEIYKQKQNDIDVSRHGRFDMLRREVAAIDGRLASARLPLGVESLDSALAGGLALGRVHMLCGRPGHDGALTGFAVALLRRILAQTDEAAPVVWCPAAAGGSGMLYAAGLAALGLDPGRLLIVDSPSPGARLAALEDILRTEGLAAVIVEYDRVSQTSDYWMRLARRAQLAAEASGVTGLLLGWPVAASGFDSLWHIAPSSLTKSSASALPSGHSSRHPSWHPCWQVELRHARGGRPWSSQLSWDAYANSLSEIRREHETEAVPEPLPFAPPGPARGSLPLRRVRPSSNGHASAQLAG
jgi:protein ImuA